MKLSSLGLLASLLITPAFAATPNAKGCAPKVKESLHAPPREWINHGSPHPEHTISLSIGLPQPNFDVLEKHLLEVSDPDHERYGAYLSKAEVDALVAPHNESVDLVTEWLASHGLNESHLDRSPAKDWVYITVPIRLAEKMLDTVSRVYCVDYDMISNIFIEILRVEAYRERGVHRPNY